MITMKTRQHFNWFTRTYALLVTVHRGAKTRMGHLMRRVFFIARSVDIKVL